MKIPLPSHSSGTVLISSNSRYLVYHHVAVFVIVPSLFVHVPMQSQYALASLHEWNRDSM